MTDFIVPRDAPQNPYREFTVTVKANSRLQIFYATTYFRILSVGVAGNLSVRFAGAGNDTTFTGVGIGLKLPAVLPWIELVNTGGADNTMTVALGIVDIEDTRFTVTGNVSVLNVGTTLTSIADVNILAGATTQVKAANANRRELFVSNLQANNTVVRWGDANVGAARGNELGIGSTAYIANTAAVFVFNPLGVAINIGVQENIT